MSDLKTQHKQRTRNVFGKRIASKRSSILSNEMISFVDHEFENQTLNQDFINQQVFPVNENKLRKSIIETTINDSIRQCK